MADFYYKIGDTASTKVPMFEKQYGRRISVVSGFDVCCNDATTTHISENGDSLTVLGYVYKPGEDTHAYLCELLSTFDQSCIVRVKRELLGQYAMVVNKGGVIYLFSDFLQSRSIYYDVETNAVSTSFAVLNPRVTNRYKVFEFFAMRGCIYPAWLGNTTFDDNIKRVRAYEYLKIKPSSCAPEVIDFKFTLDNSKIESLKDVKSHTLSVLQASIRHPLLRDKRVCSTITGGFDSRFVTALVNEYYWDVTLRIATYEKSSSLDYDIAQRVTELLGLPLDVYTTDLLSARETFYDLTDALTPQENGIMTELLNHTGKYDVGFGGAFGTELYTTAPHNTIDELVTDFVGRSAKAIKAKELFYNHFEQSLRDELANIKSHYELRSPDQRDWMRIFRLINTGYFSAPVTSAFNIQGKQYEVFGTFPVIEAGLKIPYEYLGSKTTFGRFYMIPKSLMEQLDCKLSKITTTHFCPMRPLSAQSFLSYLTGKIHRRQYYKQRAGAKSHNAETLSYIADDMEYKSNGWFDGFMRRYLTL